MARLIATIKAVITRIIFGAHGAIAIWQVTQYKKNPMYWCLSTPIGTKASNFTGNNNLFGTS
jgi:Transmembrane protein 26